MEQTGFVTGGTGFLGLNLVEQLTTAGWQITALHRPSSNLEYIKRFRVKCVEGDVLDVSSLRKVIPEAVDVVFHAAADTSMWSRHNIRQTRINVEGTRNVVTAALERGAGRLVHTSTWNTYGLQQGAIDETSPQQGGESWINYDRTKYLAEVEVRKGLERGLNAVILNPAHIMGRYDQHNWARMIRLIAENRLPGVPPGSGCFCHGQEVARTHISAALRGRTGENYLLSGVAASFVELARTVGAVTGRPVPSRPLPEFLLRWGAYADTAFAAITGREPQATPEGVAMVVAHPRSRSNKARDELGYRIVPLRPIIEDCIHWLQVEGLLNLA